MREILFFHASYCPPCVLMKKVAEDIAKETGIPLTMIDVERHPELAEQYDVTRLPQFISLEDGRKLAQTTGALDPEWLKEALKL